MTIALYPGSFDPFTNGHLDLVTRAAKLFDHVHVSIGVNPDKEGFFTCHERMELIQACVKSLPNVIVGTHIGLTVEHCRTVGATVLLRGLRTVSDFESEMTMGLVNQKLDNDIQTMFLLTSEGTSATSSSMVRGLAKVNSNINLSQFVPYPVAKALREKIGKMHEV